MISGAEFKKLVNLPKIFEDNSVITLSERCNEKIQRNIISVSGKEGFILNVSRGKIDLKKVKYQTRYKNDNTILLRIDTSGSRHQNPDGNYVNCPHIHIYTEGYGDSWAYALDPKIFSDNTDNCAILKDFLTYFNITKIPCILSECRLI